MPLKLVDGTAVPVPLGKPAVVLYSTPYAVTALQPFAGMVPANVAEVVVMADATPVVTVGTELTPAPVAAAFTAVAPPPPTAILPLYDCTNVGVNCTNIC